MAQPYYLTSSRTSEYQNTHFVPYRTRLESMPYVCLLARRSSQHSLPCTPCPTEPNVGTASPQSKQTFSGPQLLSDQGDRQRDYVMFAN